MSNEHDIKTLNSLIETVIDSADGYSQAAKEADGSRFADIFRRRGAERQQLTVQLQGKVSALGGAPEDDGTVLAKAHRMFLNLRNSMSSDDTTIVDRSRPARIISSTSSRTLCATGRSAAQRWPISKRLIWL